VPSINGTCINISIDFEYTPIDNSFRPSSHKSSPTASVVTVHQNVTHITATVDKTHG